MWPTWYYPCSDEDESPGKRAAPYMTTPPGRLTQITSSLSKEGDSDKMEIGTSEGVTIGVNIAVRVSSVL